MRKEDRRNAYTEKVIRDALYQLLQSSPINKISVTEVCRLAEINRSTFYLHYTDCQDVLNKEIDKACDRLITYLDEHRNTDMFDTVLEFRDLLLRDKELIFLAQHSANPTAAFQKFVNYAKHALAMRITETTSLPENAAEWVAQFAGAGALSAILTVAQEGQSEELRENAIRSYFTGGLKELRAVYPPKENK